MKMELSKILFRKINLLVVILSVLISESILGSINVALTSINSETVDDSTLIQLQMDSRVPEEGVKREDHGSFVQVVLDGVNVLNPGTFYDGNSKFVRKIAAYQINENQAGVRLFVSQKAANIMPALAIDHLGKVLALRIDHDLIVGLSQDQKRNQVSGVPSAEEVIENTKVRGDIKDPAVITKTAIQQPISGDSNQGQAEIDGDKILMDNLNYIALVSVVILSLLLLSLFSKRFLRRHRKSDYDLTALQIKALSNMHLAPKQRLTLLEVAGQKILISVSPDQINYLTTITENSSSTEIQRPTSMKPESLKAGTNADDSLKRTPLHLQSDKENGQKVMEGIKGSQSAFNSDRVMPRTRSTTSYKVSGNQAAQLIKDSGEAAFNVDIGRPPQDTKMKAKSGSEGDVPEPKSIEDVTNLIRRKLKDLPKL